MIGRMALVFLVAFAVLLAGCTQSTLNQPDSGNTVQPDGTMIKPDGTMVKPDGTMVKPDGTMILPDGTMVEPNGSGSQGTGSSSGSSYEPFSKAKFDEARASGKRVFLNFYASWCPICRTQEPTIQQAFSELPSNESVAGFRVNYNDNQTDDDERELARAFGISYQHSFVLLDAQGNVELKEIGAQWSKETMIQKLSSGA